MVDFWTRILNRAIPEPQPPEPLTTDRIDAGYRLFWTKIALNWDSDRRTMMAGQVADVIGASDFENNALERRFHVEGLDEQAHSGASLLALAEVLRALDGYEE
jgi:hypothetical protein